MSADTERDRVVAWLRTIAADHLELSDARKAGGEHLLAVASFGAATSLEQAADALSRNAHREARHD